MIKLRKHKNNNIVSESCTPCTNSLTKFNDLVALIDFHASATNVVQIHSQVATQGNDQL